MKTDFFAIIMNSKGYKNVVMSIPWCTLYTEEKVLGGCRGLSVVIHDIVYGFTEKMLSQFTGNLWFYKLLHYSFSVGH